MTNTIPEGFHVRDTGIDRYDMIDDTVISDQDLVLIEYPDKTREFRRLSLDVRENLIVQGHDEFTADLKGEDVRAFFEIWHRGLFIRVYLRDIGDRVTVSRPLGQTTSIEERP